MHLAIVDTPIDRPITSVDIALNHHALKVPGRCNRNASVNHAIQSLDGPVARPALTSNVTGRVGLPEGFGCLHFGG